MPVAGIPSLKELPVKGSPPADVLIAETSLATETFPAATVLLPSYKLFCISPIVKSGMHVDTLATQRLAKRHVSVHFVKLFREQLFLTAHRAHDKMAVFPGPICHSLAKLVRTVGAWDRGYSVSR